MALMIVTGTGRSGTTYMSKLLDIGHEATFTPEGIQHPMTHDSSVFASRYVDMHLGDAYRLHVVREPTACIASLAPGVVFQMAEPKRRKNRYREWCRHQWPEVYDQPTPLKRAARWYWLVNQHVEKHADETVAVENIHPEMVERWTRVMGRPAGGDHLRRLMTVPTDVNTRQQQKPTVAWSDLPSEVHDMAERYGYA